MTPRQKPAKLQSHPTGAPESTTEAQAAVTSQPEMWTQPNLFAQPLEATPAGEKYLKQSDANPNVEPTPRFDKPFKSTQVEETVIADGIPRPARANGQEENGLDDSPQGNAESQETPSGPSPVHGTDIMDVVPVPTIADRQEGRVTDVYPGDNVNIATVVTVCTITEELSDDEPTKTASQSPSSDAAPAPNSSQLTPPSEYLEPCARADSSPDAETRLDAIPREQVNAAAEQSATEVRFFRLRELEIHPAISIQLDALGIKSAWEALWKGHRDMPWFTTEMGMQILVNQTEFSGVMIDGRPRIITNTWILQHAKEICSSEESIRVRLKSDTSDVELHNAAICEYVLLPNLYLLPHDGETLRTLRNAYKRISHNSRMIATVTGKLFSNWFQCGIRNLTPPKGHTDVSSSTIQ